MATGKYISYIRVSTDRQGKSGLGLEAQRQAIETYLNGGKWTILQEYVEVESGKKTTNRPQLQAALQHCQRTHATLLIAKLDRLSRNVAFTRALMESGVEFVAVDFPTANKLTIHILSAMAEYESEMISKRTKAALKIAKQRGVVLGHPSNLTPTAMDKGRPLARHARQVKADTYAKRFEEIIQEHRAKGLSLRAIAKAMIQEGELTPRGLTNWTPTTVKNILARIEREVKQ